MKESPVEGARRSRPVVPEPEVEPELVPLDDVPLRLPEEEGSTREEDEERELESFREPLRDSGLPEVLPERPVVLRSRSTERLSVPREELVLASLEVLWLPLEEVTEESSGCRERERSWVLPRLTSGRPRLK